MTTEISKTAPYGVLVGAVKDGQYYAGGKSPHYQLWIVAGSTNFRIAVNVRSETGSEVLVHYDPSYALPTKRDLPALASGPPGFTALTTAGSVALRGAAAHRAASDALVTGHIFHMALTRFEEQRPEADIVDYVEYVASPVPVTRLFFGKKHWGKALAEVPTDYYEWMFRNVEKMDGDLRAAIEAEMEKRHECNAA
jgi:hypothetical protein